MIRYKLFEKAVKLHWCKKKKKAHQMMCKNEINSKSLKSTWKNISVFTNVFPPKSRNIFSCVYSAFPIINIFNVFTCPLAILPNILEHDNCRKNKATTALQINRLARLFGYSTFCCWTDFLKLRVPEWKVDNTMASWNDELQTTCARRKWSRKLFDVKMYFKCCSR